VQIGFVARLSWGQQPAGDATHLSFDDTAKETIRTESPDAIVRAVKHGLVSTILPVHNRPQMLRDAAGSVLAQTHRPIELLIVDDGSTDETAAVADGLARAHSEICVIHQPNAGPGRAREAGRRMATGEFIQHLDSDDLLEPAKFETQIAGLYQHPECGVSYGWTRMRFRDGSIHAAPWKGTGARVETMFPSMLRSRWWDTTTPLYRASLMELAGPWLDLRCEEDWEYDCRIAATGVRLHFVEGWVSETRQHAAHVSGQRGRRTLRDRAAAHEAILGHARRFGITEGAPEMRHFARELFLLARQCGAVGAPEEAARLFALARSASGREGGRVQFRLYSFLAWLLGWEAMGKISMMVDKLRT
jgi:Glycosyl transferase family 2